LIFSEIDGTPIGPRNILKAFKHILEISTIPEIRFHDLRPTAATQMIANGVDILTLSKRLGHAKTSITLDIYAHAIPGLHEKAALKLTIKSSAVCGIIFFTTHP
jgi:integrase